MYYCTFLGRQAGPFTREEIYTFIREGQLQKNSLITCDGETKAAEHWPEFKVLFIATQKNSASKKVYTPNLSHHTQQSESLITRKRGLLLFVKVLGFLSIFYGTFLLYKVHLKTKTIILTLPIYYTDYNMLFDFTLIVVSVSSVITAICIRDIYKFPNKSVSTMALVGLEVIFANTLITGTPCYEPLFRIGFVDLMAVALLIFYIPYTLIVGGIALYLNHKTV